MPYIPKFPILIKILFRRADIAAAEALWMEGTWLNEQGEGEAARLAFSHSRLLDRGFGGAYYNYAALTEKLLGPKSPETLKAWKDYVRVAQGDKRQARTTVEKVRIHIIDLERSAGKSLLPTTKP